jgi:hypothetical protein
MTIDQSTNVLQSNHHFKGQPIRQPCNNNILARLLLRREKVKKPKKVSFSSPLKSISGKVRPNSCYRCVPLLTILNFFQPFLTIAAELWDTFTRDRKHQNPDVPIIFRQLTPYLRSVFLRIRYYFFRVRRSVILNNGSRRQTNFGSDRIRILPTHFVALEKNMLYNRYR